MPPRSKTSVPPPPTTAAQSSSLITSFFSRIEPIAPAVRANVVVSAPPARSSGERRGPVVGARTATAGKKSIRPSQTRAPRPAVSARSLLSNSHLHRPLDDAVYPDAAMVAEPPGDEGGMMVDDVFMPPPPLGPPMMRTDDEEEHHHHYSVRMELSSFVDHPTYPAAEEIIEHDDADHQNGTAAARTAAGPDAGHDDEPDRPSSLSSSLRELLDDDHHLFNKRQRTSGSSSTSTFSTADPTIIRKRRKIKSKRQKTNHSFQSSRNIVHQLVSRSLIGSSRHHHSGSVMMIRCDQNMMHRDKRWKVASTLRIPTPSSSSSHSNTAANMLVAFDRDGSLLAVTHGRAELSVYDWQSMRLTTRRRRTNDDAGGHHTTAATMAATDCPPILQFKVGPFSVPIALLAWNPFHEDEIVIGLRATGSVFIMDLQLVQGWLEDQPPYGSAAMPPCSELRCFETGPRDLPGIVGVAVINRSSCFVLVDEGRVALLSAGTTVFCWKLPPRASRLGARTSPFWRYQCSDMISTMAILSAETVVLGGESGSITILNWKKTQCNAFSCQPTPTISARFDGPGNGNLVRTVRLTAVKKLIDQFFRLTWLSQHEQISSVTVCLGSESITFDQPKVNAAGKNLPFVQACALADSETFIWNAFQILVNAAGPDESRTIHDDRVLRQEGDDRLKYTRREPLLKCWVENGKGTISSQSFTDEIGSIKSMALHPSSEYVVLGTGSNTLVVMADRA